MKNASPRLTTSSSLSRWRSSPRWSSLRVCRFHALSVVALPPKLVRIFRLTPAVWNRSAWPIVRAVFPVFPRIPGVALLVPALLGAPPAPFPPLFSKPPALRRGICFAAPAKIPGAPPPIASRPVSEKGAVSPGLLFPAVSATESAVLPLVNEDIALHWPPERISAHCRDLLRSRHGASRIVIQPPLAKLGRMPCDRDIMSRVRPVAEMANSSAEPVKGTRFATIECRIASEAWCPAQRFK